MNEKPFGLDMPFEEALRRLINAPKDVIDKKDERPSNRAPIKKPKKREAS